jgi:sugar phosphate isomerase/epimerase
MTKTYTFGVITDEIDQDFARACHIAHEEGMRYVEIHTLWGKNIDELTPAELDQVERILDDHELRTHLVCGLLFRPFSLADVALATLEQHPRFLEHMAKLERFIAIAQRLRAPYIRTFGFTRDVGGGNPSPRSPDGGGISDETLAKIAKGLRPACERVAEAGLMLALENARSLYANTGGNMRRVLDAVEHPALKIIWDPANAYVAGEDPASGYQAVRGQIVDIHCKDATVVDPATGLTAWARIGEGGTGWTEHLALLRAEPVDTYTIETHWNPGGQDKATNTRQTFASLKQLIAALDGAGAVTSSNASLKGASA